MNREAALLADDRSAQPRVSLLAVTLGALLIIPPFRSMYTTAQRVGAATGSWPGTGKNLLLTIILPLLPAMYGTAKTVGAESGRWAVPENDTLLVVILALLALISYPLYMSWVQGKLNRHLRLRQEQETRVELMQRAQVRVVGVQADIERERSIHSW